MAIGRGDEPAESTWVRARGGQFCTGGEKRGVRGREGAGLFLDLSNKCPTTNGLIK